MQYEQCKVITAVINEKYQTKVACYHLMNQSVRVDIRRATGIAESLEFLLEEEGTVVMKEWDAEYNIFECNLNIVFM